MYKFRKPHNRGMSDVILLTGSMCLLLMTAFYFCGFITGFDVNYNVLYRRYILPQTWIITFLIVITSEITRYCVYSIEDRGEKKYLVTKILMFICLILVDLSIITKTYDLSSFSQFYEFFALVLVTSISKNLFLNYLSKRYGYYPCLVYRLIMDLYIYFIPITPKLNIFIESVILLVFPYVIYIILQRIAKRRTLGPARKNNNYFEKFLSFVTSIIFIVVVALVSREFRYSMIAIGSGSMTGTINKGDAVIYETFDEEKLNVGDIIVFNKNNVMIVHRIYKVYEVDNTLMYQTKGDANDIADNWILESEDIIGVVKLKVPLIAWPSVILNEIFS